MHGHQAEGSSSGAGQGWGCLFHHVLDGVQCAMAEHEAIVFLRCGRLVNRHWCQWATQATKHLELTIKGHFDAWNWDELEKNALRRMALLRKCTLSGKCSTRKYCPGALTTAMVKSFTALEALALKGAEAADLQPLQQLPNLQHLKLSIARKHHQGVRKYGMMHVAAVTGLVSLELSCCNLSDEGVGLLVSLVCLEKLSLQGCQKITDACTCTLVPLPALADVNLKDCPRITDVGIVHLAKLTSLVRLMLGQDSGGSQSISDEGARVLGKMTNLVALDVGHGCGISDGGVKHLKSLTNLAYLNLPRNTSDATLLSLRSLTAISHLKMSECANVTDRGLECLTQFHNLVRLELHTCGNDGRKFIGELTSLINLSLWGSTADSIEGLTALTNLTALRAVWLGGTLAAVQVFSTLTNLKTLAFTIRSAPLIADLQWISVLTRLTDLSLSYQSYLTITNVFDCKILEYLPDLTRLDLAHSSELTDESLMTITRLTNLAVLDLSCCMRITWDGLMQLAPLRLLTRVRLVGCMQLLF